MKQKKGEKKKRNMYDVRKQHEWNVWFAYFSNAHPLACGCILRLYLSRARVHESCSQEVPHVNALAAQSNTCAFFMRITINCTFE